MSHVRRFDHVGLTVADLDVVTAFFVALGLDVEGRTFVEGEFLDTVCGIPDSRTEIVMLKPPDDGTRLELSSFVRPDSVPGSPAAMANELGLRNVAFEVNDLQEAVDWAATEGYGLVGASASTRAPGGWPTSGGRKGSSSRWPSASAEPRNARICRDPGAWGVAWKPCISGRSGRYIIGTPRLGRLGGHAVALDKPDDSYVAFISGGRR
jgi:catechol 2,3-dioxygenase-like lactoylglutathione lyase family enzyme